MSKPGQGKSDTLSYDRPLLSDGGGNKAPAPRPGQASTVVMPDGLAGADAALAGRLTDPAAVAPAPQSPLALTPPKDPIVERAPGAFRAGDLVDHFEIVGLVGQGGMGCVYKAFDRDLGRTVAIKTLHGIDQQAPQSLARFKREAQAASRVVHPNLVIIYSSGTFGETPYIVMEYLSGRNLAAEIAEGPIEISRTADILGAACAGVYAAHRAEVVHRDLKPPNIFLAKTPMGETPKILDFGISRIGDDNSSLTGTGDVVGTTYYLAPEQAAGKGIDARADQYALGVILYECLTGERPFTGAAVYTIMKNIVEGVFLPPCQLRPEIPRELEAVVMRAMSRAPEDRFARVRDLGLALVPFMSVKGRQQWGHHFMVPEAEMPIAPSLALPPPPGADHPAASPATSAIPQPPTKVLPHAQPEAATRTRHPSDDGFAEITMSSLKAGPRLSRGVLIAAGVVVLLLAAVAWTLWRPSEATRPLPAEGQAAPRPALPAISEPVPPPPSAPSAGPAAAYESDDPFDNRGRDLQKKAAIKGGKSKESVEPSEKAESTPNHQPEIDPKTLKPGMW
jgi:serine/threonine protein kinase